MKIDLKTIKELAENVGRYNLNEVALESDGVKLVLKKEKLNVQPATEMVIPQQMMVQPQPVVEKKVAIPVVENDNYEYITAPMVGTFYKSSAPGNPAFVEVGQEVNSGDTLCIIEAMKLMNEVKATKNAKIVKVLVENGQVVKKGDKLFAIE